MCAKLGIELIAASSPQAKGRVERNHGTHQDRLIKKLRRKEIGTHAEVNTYLEREYLPEHNRRFARAAMRKQPHGEVNYSSDGDTFYPHYRSVNYIDVSRKAFFKDGRFS